MSTALNIACLIIEFVVLFFLVFSVGWDVLKMKGGLYDAFGCSLAATILNSTRVDQNGKCDQICYSLWGVKKCGAHNPNRAMPHWGFPDKKTKQITNCAGSFDIISVAMALVAFILNILLAAHCVPSWIVLVFYVIVVVTGVVALGCLLGVYYYNLVDSFGPFLASLSPVYANRTNIKVKEVFSMYSAAGIIICGWCLQVINLVLMIVYVCCCPSSPSSSSPKKGSDDEEKKTNHAPDNEDTQSNHAPDQENEEL